MMIKAMAVALSSPGVAFHLRSPALSSNFRNQNASPSLLSLPTHRASRSVLVFGRGKNRKGFVSSSSSSPKKNKKVRKSHYAYSFPCRKDENFRSWFDLKFQPFDFFGRKVLGEMIMEEVRRRRRRMIHLRHCLIYWKKI